MLSKYVVAEHRMKGKLRIGLVGQPCWFSESRAEAEGRVAAVIKRRKGLVRKWSSLDIGHRLHGNLSVFQLGLHSSASGMRSSKLKL